MVCSNTQSALYRGFERHKSECCRGSNSEDFRSFINGSRIPQKKGENHTKNASQNHQKNESDHQPQNGCRSCPNNSGRNPLDSLFSDSDMLLIAGLIFVLMTQKADNKLIIALAIALLG